MTSPRRSLEDVNPNNALLWAEFRTQYIYNGLSVTDNLGRYPGAPKTLLMGDGTTASTIPAQIAGKKGFNFAGSQYVDTGIIDPFERTDKFSIFVFYSKYGSSNAFILGNNDAAQDNKGIGFYFHGTSLLTSERTLVFANKWDTNMIYTSNFCNQNLFNSFGITSNGSSTTAGINLYSDGINTSQTAQVNALTASVKNGKPFLLAARHNGSSKTSISGCNIHFVVIFPWDLTPQQIQYLDRLVRTKINQP